MDKKMRNNTCRINALFIILALFALIYMPGCSAASINKPEPFKVSDTIRTKCLNGVFEMEIPAGMVSRGTESISNDTTLETFFPEKGGTDSGIYIHANEVPPTIGADEFASSYFDGPSLVETYKYKNIKVKKLSNNHYMSIADKYEEGEEESTEKEIVFSIDGDIMIHISFKNLQKSYVNTVESTLKIL